MKYSGYIPVLSLLLNSCIGLGTLHPISDKEADFIFKEELIGTWGEYPKDSSRFFSADTSAGTNGKFYSIKYIHYDVDEEKTDTICTSARLAYLNKSYFLDYQLCKDSFNEDYVDMLIMKHFIVKINFTETGNIEMISPDVNEFIKLIDQKKIALNYILLNEDDYLILDKPAILKKAILTSLKYPSVYKEKIILQRLE